jgi:glycosyltransferase involved in cell wall biosynthesis
MRIALVANSYPPNARGGAGQIAFLQAEWLKSHGHEVRIFVPEPFPMPTSDPSITVFKPQTTTAFADLSKHNFLSRLIFHFEDLSPNIRLIESIRNFKPDVILTHNLTGCGWSTVKILSQTGIRWIHILHDVQMVEPSGQILHNESLPALHRLWRTFWAKQRSKALGSPHVVISPSYWLLKYHQSFNLFPNSKTTVIPNPAVLSKTELGTQNFDTATKKVLYVGRVSKDKGLDVLINAWQLLKSSNFEFRISKYESTPPDAKYDIRNSKYESTPPDAKYDIRNSKYESTPPDAKYDIRNSKFELFIIGSGPYLQVIKKLNDETIKCVGALDHDKLADYYSSALLMVFPSLLMENQPTVLLEAMSAGVNIVASDIGGVGELLQGYGSLIPPNDAKKLADAIMRELNNPPNFDLAQSITAKHDLDFVMPELENLLT